MISVFVENLHFNAIIGLLPFERETSQVVRIDAELTADEFIDYGALCEYFKFEMRGRKFEKVEDALEFFKFDLKVKYPSLRSLSIKITKPNIIKNALVGAKISHAY